MHHNSVNFVINGGTVWFILQSIWPFWSWKCLSLHNVAGFLIVFKWYLLTFLPNLLSKNIEVFYPRKLFIATRYTCSIVFAALQNEFKILKICCWAKSCRRNGDNFFANLTNEYYAPTLRNFVVFLCVPPRFTYF